MAEADRLMPLICFLAFFLSCWTEISRDPNGNAKVGNPKKIVGISQEQEDPGRYTPV